MLLSETRLSNTELRINMTRMTDKIDELLRRTEKQGSVYEPSGSVRDRVPDSLAHIAKEIQLIKAQTSEIHDRLRSSGPIPDLARTQAEKFRELRDVLKEKEEQLRRVAEEREEELRRVAVEREEERTLVQRQDQLLRRLQVSGQESKINYKTEISSRSSFFTCIHVSTR